MYKSTSLSRIRNVDPKKLFAYWSFVRRRFDLLELGAPVDAENVYQVEIRRDEPDRTARVSIHMLDYDALAHVSGY